ncbi:hypothetical protein ABPG72_018741 [Tetrahymena utriculariae]
MNKLPLADKQTFLKWSKLYFVALIILFLITVYIDPSPPLTPRQQHQIKKQEDKKLMELMKCCQINSVYSFDKDFTTTTYHPLSMFYNYEVQAFYLTQFINEKKTEINQFSVANSTQSTKGFVENQLLYVYSDDSKISFISKSNNDKSESKQLGENLTEKINKLVHQVKALCYSISIAKGTKKSEILIIDNEHHLHLIDNKFENPKREVELSGFDQIKKLENFQIASLLNYLLILESNSSKIHVFERQRGKFVKQIIVEFYTTHMHFFLILRSINVEEVSKFASRGVEIGQKDDTLIHPNTIATNEYDQTGGMEFMDSTLDKMNQTFSQSYDQSQKKYIKYVSAFDMTALKKI